MAKGVLLNVCSDNEPMFDMALWRENKGTLVQIVHPPVSIKHGIGLAGGGGHRKEFYRDFDDTGGMVLQGWVDDEAMKLYREIVREWNVHTPEPLTESEWVTIHERI